MESGEPTLPHTERIMATFHKNTQCRRQRQSHQQTRQHQQQQQQQQLEQSQQCNKIAIGKSLTTATLQAKQQRQQIKKNLVQRKAALVENLHPPTDSFACSAIYRHISQKIKYTKNTKTTTTKATPTVRQHRNLSKAPTNSTSTIKFDKETKSEKFCFKHTKWHFNSIWHLNSTLCIMLTMFVVATVVISGNAAHASQRDSYKIKEAKVLGGNGNGIGNSVNAIPADIYAPVGGDGHDEGNGNVNVNGNGSTASANGGDTINMKTGTAASNTILGNAATTSTSTANINMNHTTVTTATATAFAATSSSIATSSSSSSSTLSSSTTSKAATSSGNSFASGNLQKVSTLSANNPAGNIGINRNVIEISEDARSGPYFDKAASRNVTALLGKTAYLNCRVKNLSNKTMMLQVSWVRHRDIHLLTVGRYTYTSDQRFRAIHQPQTEDWILQIKYPQHRDSGIYECQVSTTPHMSHYIHLNVVEPSTEIIGAPDLYIESGSTINLTCVILNSPEPPAYIFWNHNNAIINYDSPRGGVSVVTNKGETTTSFLLIKSARPSDSGLYQCNPSNAKPKSVTVHVLNGEFPAAMQRAVLGPHRMSQSHYVLVYLFMYLFTLVYVGHFMELSRQPLQSLQPISRKDGKTHVTQQHALNEVAPLKIQQHKIPICHYY